MSSRRKLGVIAARMPDCNTIPQLDMVASLLVQQGFIRQHLNSVHHNSSAPPGNPVSVTNAEAGCHSLVCRPIGATQNHLTRDPAAQLAVDSSTSCDAPSHRGVGITAWRKDPLRNQLGLACCRFHGHRVKVFMIEPEVTNEEKKVQSRVQV